MQLAKFYKILIYLTFSNTELEICSLDINETELLDEDHKQNELLHPHGQHWEHLENGIPIDQKKSYRQQFHLKWPQVLENCEKTPFDYFQLLFPMQKIKDIVNFTNKQLEVMDIVTEMTTGEFLKYLGVRLAMSLSSNVGGYREHWRTTELDNSVRIAENYSKRFGMSLRRFETITSALRFEPTLVATDHVLEIQIFWYIFIENSKVMKFLFFCMYL